jgi:hypothetical protein
VTKKPAKPKTPAKERAKMRFDGIQEVVMHGHLFWWTHAMAAVWMVIWAHENAKNWRSRTGYPLIRRELGIKRPNRPVRALIAGGYLTRMSGGHGSVVSVYKLDVPNIRFVDVPAVRAAASGKPWPADQVANWLEIVQPCEDLAAKYAPGIDQTLCAPVADLVRATALHPCAPARTGTANVHASPNGSPLGAATAATGIGTTECKM